MRPAIAACVVLLVICSPALSKDIKAKDVTHRLEVLTEVMKLLAQRSLLESRYMDACTAYTHAVVYGGTKYKSLLDGVKVIMLPDEIAECRDRARESLLRRLLKAKLEAGE